MFHEYETCTIISIRTISRKCLRGHVRMGSICEIYIEWSLILVQDCVVGFENISLYMGRFVEYYIYR